MHRKHKSLQERLHKKLNRYPGQSGISLSALIHLLVGKHYKQISEQSESWLYLLLHQYFNRERLSANC